MSKSKWEGKVGALLKTDQFVWSHKCPDIFDRRHPYAGRSRVDWVALDQFGNGWMIEVKYLDRKVNTMFHLFNTRDGVSPGQRGELQDFARAGYALLAVGHAGTNALYIFEWDWVEQTVERICQTPEQVQDFRLELTGAGRIIRYPRGRVEEEYLWSQSQHPASKLLLASSLPTFTKEALKKNLSFVES